jgi:N-methylhydantoinase A
MLIGVDIGGTFTDLVLSAGGQLSVHKLPSTPQNPASAMLDGIEAITGGRLDQLARVAHGSTVATNAILERKGGRVAFITTQGFRDLLLIGRQNRPVLYAMQPTLPEPLIPRDRCYEVPERLDYSGAVLLELDMTALDAVLDAIAGQDVAAVAVCLLYSYANPQHEQAIRDRIVERGLLEPWQVALSSDVLPEFREYERASTTALEAYVRPVMGRYVARLEEELHTRSPKTGLRIMKSDGGVMSASRVRAQAIHTALSGPAAGVIGAFHVASLAGYDRVITLDMGGTSTDVAICPGEVVRRPGSEIDGLPLRVRLLDIETIGAGGGSIARVDAGGALRVGPESAGADPGPACYGRGGKLPTVSDAHAVLGRLDPAHFLGGSMTLKLDAAEKALQTVAKPLGLSAEVAAQGIVEVANVNIDRALRRISVARGYDPREFTLVTFGGAGGLHACAVAQRLEIPRVLVPRYPGVLCAFGLLMADVVLDYSQSILVNAVETSPLDLAELIETMLIRARDDLKSEGIPRRRRSFSVTVDMRYIGQAYELNVPLHADRDVRETFHEAHQLAYGHALRDRPIEIVSLRVQAVGMVERPSLEPESAGDEDEFAGARHAVPSTAMLGEKKGPDGGKIALYDREGLDPGARFEGPALVFQLDSTTYVAAGWSARVDGYRNLILEWDEQPKTIF